MGGKTVVESPPPAPSATETAQDIYKARLQYEPQIARHELQIQQEVMPEWTRLMTDMQQQYSPQLAQIFTDIQKQQMPQLQELQAKLFPQQSQVVETAAGQALEGLKADEDPLMTAMREQATQRMGAADYATPEQQQALEAIRGRQRKQLTRGLRGREAMTGTLYGGRAARREEEALGELEQQFATQDIDRLMQQQQMAYQQASLLPQIQSAMQTQALQRATPLMQILYPQVQAPQAQAERFGYTGVTPTPNSQLSAAMQANQMLNQANITNAQNASAQQQAMWSGLGQLGGQALPFAYSSFS